MVYGHFFENRRAIEEQYRNVQWIESSGLSLQALSEAFDRLVTRLAEQEQPRSLIKANALAFVLDHARLAVTPETIFQDHLQHGMLVQKLRGVWMEEMQRGPLQEVNQSNQRLYGLGLGQAQGDFSHTVPDWYDILALGLPGLLDRLAQYRQRYMEAGVFTQEREDFYQSGIIALQGVVRFVRRLSQACQDTADRIQGEGGERLRFCAESLRALTLHAPQTLQQALQLAYLWHLCQSTLEGERIRSMGGLDRLYTRFMESDLQSGVLTKERLTETWQHFFQKFHAFNGDTSFGEPMYLGGLLPGGECAVNAFSHLILEAYDVLNVVNPKFHIRVSRKTPPEFLKKVLDCVRRGNSSFVFVSDECAVPMMMKYVGATLEEAREWVPVGCYEPGIQGREVACTGNGGMSLPKVLELTLNRGADPLSGETIGLDLGSCGDFDSFDKLMAAFRQQVEYFVKVLTSHVRAYEKHYMQLNPSPLFSSSMIECVQKGRDAYAGGAKYNNCSLYGYGIATAADSLAMIRKTVYDGGEMTLQAFQEILLSNWEGRELLRMRAVKDADKFGNNRDLPDSIACEISRHFADAVNAVPNQRGGHFKAALFSIDYNYYYGKHLGASADGRKAGDMISRNTGASSTMDRNGVTAHIHSVTRLPLNRFPTGSVLDIMLHPSAVAGEEGLEVFHRLLRSYFAMGGFGIHGNVMDAKVLRDAQAHPEKYPNLQVRVCGWNVYFVNLSREEQNEFITRAEAC